MTKREGVLDITVDSPYTALIQNITHAEPIHAATNDRTRKRGYNDPSRHEHVYCPKHLLPHPSKYVLSIADVATYVATAVNTVPSWCDGDAISGA